ncbi:lysozyme inhibitor LprI family protein [Reinekea blandensis]|uniref:Lysozyme inhibitor LprI-like N-terminal domain-containing protein n=1 Tax=Reinekea blandensis MED297 TaxID=314283 RepID=A4BIA5_9GAMM|nr:lysozyme inhibitor LprI family protein [Reinekea blandensis]EAR08112.1 hypothetical protein MED297_00450 [Reinekea sp. MED297] [Reinekea blandensis MED297]
MKKVSRDVANIKSLLIGLSFLVCLDAGAASFDCENAVTSIEKEICRSSELSELDERLAKSYQQARSVSTEDEALSIREAQIAWINDRDETCSEQSNLNECLIEQYKLRLIDLAVYNGGLTTPVLLELVKGGQYEVCRSVLNYFERENSLELMKSRDPFLNGGGELVMPQWQMEDNLAVGFKLKMQSISFVPKTVSQWRKLIEFNEQLLTKDMQTRSAEFNINNSGAVEKVVSISTYGDGKYYQHNSAVTEDTNLDHEFLNEYGGGFNSISGSLFTYNGRGFSGRVFLDSFKIGELFDSPMREDGGLYFKDEVCVININESGS